MLKIIVKYRTTCYWRISQPHSYERKFEYYGRFYNTSHNTFNCTKYQRELMTNDIQNKKKENSAMT